MKKTLIVVGIFILAMIAAAGIFWGCNSDSNSQGVISAQRSQGSGAQENAQRTAIDAAHSRSFALDELTSEVILFDGSTGQDAGIASVLTDQNAQTAFEWLAGEGYTYTDSNSLVFVINRYRHDTSGVNISPEARVARMRPDPVPRSVLVESDTIVWRAFENPSHSMSVHTALITGWANQEQKRTALLELDVTTPIPTEIRKGRFHDGVFAPGDLNTEGFRSCFLLGSGGAAVGCLLSNCGWAACTAFGIGGAGLACAVAGIFGWL